MTDFQTLIGALATGEVEFVIVGGLAATVHGSARLTQDIDVVYARDDANFACLVTSLAPFAHIPGALHRDCPSNGLRRRLREV